MAISIMLRDIIAFLIGLVVGYFTRVFISKYFGEEIEKVLFGMVVVASWVYVNVILQVGDWWINLFMALVIVQFFDPRKLKELFNRGESK
jgi:hypothetical protein